MTTPTPETALARRFRLDADLSVAQDGSNWQQFFGITDFQPTTPPEIQDSTTYDTDGWAENTKTLQSWQLAITFNRQTSSDGTSYNTVHEAFRTAALGFGAGSKIPVRWYDRNGLPEAYQGLALVTWEPQGGDAKALDQVKLTLTGTGPLTLITNPVTP